MTASDWLEELPFSLTRCDAQGVIVQMNARARQTFAGSGGAALIGKSLLECHPEAAREKLASLLAEPHPNSYTIEKNGVKKLIHQSPVYENGVFAGLVELSIELPPELPHFVRGS